MAVIAGRNVGNNELGIMAGGLVVFVASFLPWYGASAFGINATVTGWNSGFLAWFPIILCIAIAGFIAARVFGNIQVPSTAPVGPTLGVAALAALATLLILLRWATLPATNIPGVSSGARVGLFLGLIGAAVQTAFGALAFRASGEALPGQSQPRR